MLIMKISKTLLQTIAVAVAISTSAACTKSVDGKSKKFFDKKTKTDSTCVIPYGCPACGMG